MHSRCLCALGSLVLAVALAPAAPSYAGNASPPTREAEVPAGASLAVYREHIAAGGPGKDGIPAIDRPRFVSAAEAEGFLAPDDIVFGVVHRGVVRAYPQRILVWHEVVNDRLGGDPVTLTYCPLTGSAVGFQRGDTSFGVSGQLVNSNLIMYDRATDSRWPQIPGLAIDGKHAGRALARIPMVWTSWARWRARHPDTEVLSRRTGHARNYRSDPYGSYNPVSGYYADRARVLFPPIHRDERLAPKTVVLAAHTEDGAVAFDKQALRQARLAHLELDGVSYLAVYDPGLDTAHVYREPGRLDPPHERIRFTADGPRLNGEPLPGEPVTVMDVFWFAWAGFYPRTALYD